MIAMLKRIRRRIGEVCLSLSAAAPTLRGPLSVMLSVFTKQELLPLSPMSSIVSEGTGTRGVLAPGQKITSIAPAEFQTVPDTARIDFPDIQFQRFGNAIIGANCAGVVLKNRFYLPDDLYAARHRIVANSFLVPSYTTRSALVLGRHRTLSLPKGIFLAGVGSFNWYHWLIEILPKTVLFQNLPAQLQDYPILVPPEFDRFPTYRQAFETLGLKNEVVVLAPYQSYQVADLICIDTPSISPFNMRQGLWPELAENCNNTTVLNSFRDQVLASLDIVTTTPHRRIFLARSNTRRDYDQASLIKMLEGLGIETVYTDRLDFKDQVQLLREAELVIGPSGAAWANMLFAQENTKGIIWTFPEYDKVACYSNIAAMVGTDLRYLFFPATLKPASTHNLYNASYDIDLPRLQNAIRKTLSDLNKKPWSQTVVPDAC